MTREIHIPDSIDTADGGEIGFGEIHRRYAGSRFGQLLAGQRRWKRFMPAAIPGDQWARAPLGADMNNLQHMPLVMGMTRSYLKHQDPAKVLNRTDSQILMLASITHDWAEAITDDIMFDLKTVAEDDDEATIMLFLLRRMLGSRLSRETLMQVYSTVKDRNSRLGRIFNAIERVGYMRSGLNAWQGSIHPRGEMMRELPLEVEQELRQSLLWMANNVAANQTQALLEYAEIYRPIEVYLDSVKTQITRLFNGMPVSIFHKYPEAEQPAKVQLFLKADQAWKQSKFGKETIAKSNDSADSEDLVAG